MTANRQRFTGCNVVVTGGNSGIGLAAAQAFAKEGARVAIVGRNAETLEAARASIGSQCLAMQGDMGKLADIDRVAARVREAFGSVDALFANAGQGGMVPVNEASEEFWDQIMNVNLKGVYFTVQKLLPLMKSGSAVVLCSSISALRTMHGSSIYSASKAAVNALSKAIATETVGAGIRVNVVMPGGTDTPIFNRAMPPEVATAVKGQMAKHTPMKRLGDPAEIAAAVLFLCSKEASFITGTELVVDGGVVGCS